MGVYPWFFSKVLTKLDPEFAHHLAFNVIRAIGSLPAPVRKVCAPHSALRVEALGMVFSSPFGLAAGFDKNATGITGLGALGFGHVEVGTLTAHAQEGNPKPRLFRLIKDRAIINRMGFNNDGSQNAVAHIERARLKKHRPVIGINIGKSRLTRPEDTTADYVTSAHLLAPIADYLVVNVSSPNTPGLRGLQELELLEPLLTRVQKAAGSTPLLVKIAPDMSNDQLDAIVDMVVRIELDGIIATNTTILREGLQEDADVVTEIGAGGLSGEPLQRRSMEVLQRIRSVAPKNLCIISVGGVSNAKDVIDRLQAGATLVQGYTAFLYEGPRWACSINRELKKMLSSVPEPSKFVGR